MNLKLFIVPSLCLGGAALLLAPARPSQAFSKLGGNLGEGQRDVRVHDNFLDATVHDNAAAASQFPGWLEVEQAVWKGIIEWSSVLHGDGTGDPIGGNTLGNGGANFDPMWSGNANGVGTNNNNIISGLTSCGGGGTLAYCETPISDGWRIRFCDEWTWDDGPGNIGNRWDIQGITTHEYGHALGLGHSANGQATMAPSGGPGASPLRSIHSDDILGIQCVYGVASATKPVITATVANAGTLTIHGSQFGSTGNEVWFTNNAVTSTSADPIVRVTSVSSSGSGTIITVSIPAAASQGDVIVNKSGSGNSTVSNAFPTDLVGTFGTPPSTGGPDITEISPSSMEALMPGTDQFILILGENFDTATALLLDGVPIPASSWTVIEPTTITLDMPQASSLGAHTIGITDGTNTDNFGVTIFAPTLPKYQIGNGDPFNVVDVDNGLDFIVSGIPGRTHRVYSSLSNLPSTNATYNLEIGNNFTSLFNNGQFVIPASGWMAVHIDASALPDPGPGGLVFYSQSVELLLPRPFKDSNVQSIQMVQ